MWTENWVKDFLAEAGVELNGPRPFDPQIRDDRFYSKLYLAPSLKIGEAYMAGWWECEQLDELFFRIFRHYNNNSLQGKGQLFVQWLWNTFLNLQTRVRAFQVAEQHYNLGNDLYTDMLGETMAYTCGYWKHAETLDQSQYAKFDLVCRKINLKAGENVLELGCGWGSFAKFASENYGCKVTGVNISSEQVAYATRHCSHLPVKIHFCDYRDVEVYNKDKILFDKVVSIGLCEHIGPKNYQTFMEIVSQNIREEGLFLLHTIGKNESSLAVDPWIHKYIFPNGMLPSIKFLAEASEGLFVLEDFHNFGADYDKTLMAWHQNFVQNWPRLRSQYDEKFYRMWVFYLLSCAGGFRARGMQLWQMVLSPKGVLGGYESIR
jgi:cyclopropane-fatty-acyl-phospholipid synthase